MEVNSIDNDRKFNIILMIKMFFVSIFNINQLIDHYFLQYKIHSILFLLNKKKFIYKLILF
jgi:hypothetical protein